MKIEKIKLNELNRVYATNFLTFYNSYYALYASESTIGEPGIAYAYPMNDLNHPEIIWDNIGGCVNILQHPYHENEFIAIQNFFLKENPSKAKVVIGKRHQDGTWETKDLFNLPLVHRIGIIKDKEKAFLIACTIAQSKENKDDWSKPGEIWVCELQKNKAEATQLTLLKSGLFHNHGFYQNVENGNDVIYIGTSNGLIKLFRENDEFKMTKLLYDSIGEIAVGDIDNDGKLELITIEPFHGNSIKIYHLYNNHYEEVWKYPSPINFAHALISGTINGKNCFFAGIRKENGEIFMVTYEDNNYHIQLIDKHVGCANLNLLHLNKENYLASANHTTHECALYKIELE